MDIYEKIKTNYYCTKLPYVSIYQDPSGYDAYRHDQCRLDAEFKKDVLEHAGLTNHPKREKVYEIAYDQGHDSGYHEILFWVDVLSDLVKD